MFESCHPDEMSRLLAAFFVGVTLRYAKPLLPPLLRSCPTGACRLRYAPGGCLPVVASLLPHGTARDRALALLGSLFPRG